MACKKALARLEKAKQTDKECIKYKICPDCGGSLITMWVMDVAKTWCGTCGSKFNRRRRGPHPEGGG